MLPDSLLETFDPDETAFQCEDEMIFIISNANMRTLNLAGWQLPEMRPLQHVRVPLWVALLLKKQDRCKIVFPDWLEEHALKNLVDQEKSRQEFSSLPWSWEPIAKLLLQSAADDLNGDLVTVREHLKDLSEARQLKIRNGVTQTLNENQISMNGMGILELNEVRPVLAKSMHVLQSLSTEQ